VLNIKLRCHKEKIQETRLGKTTPSIGCVREIARFKVKQKEILNCCRKPKWLEISCHYLPFLKLQSEDSMTIENMWSIDVINKTLPLIRIPGLRIPSPEAVVRVVWNDGKRMRSLVGYLEEV